MDAELLRLPFAADKIVSRWGNSEVLMSSRRNKRSMSQFAGTIGLLHCNKIAALALYQTPQVLHMKDAAASVIYTS